MTQEKLKFPIIFYEDADDDENVIPIPYIPMEKDDEWPFILFIQEYRDTGEIEPDEEGNPQAICDVYMHKYIDMEHLKDKLDPETNDVVRVALGMKPLKEAQKAGSIDLEKIFNKVNNKGTIK